MARVIRGYWDCPSCGNKGIDGLLDHCPHCGSAKDKNVRYYMKSREDVVRDEELEKARIHKNELDGKHKDWLCSYCGYLNRYSDEICMQCGAPKSEKKGDYGDNFAADDAAKAEKEKKREEALSQTGVETFGGGGSNKKPVTRGLPFKVPFILLPVLILLFLFFPVGRTVEVTGFSWNREVDIETYTTIQENNWTMPRDGDLLYTREEISYYQSVLDHYETRYVTAYRDVIDHYETKYEYIDNGNGTFTENSYEVPVYTTEAYQVEEQVPIYVQVPVYATMYYYEVDRWIVTDEKTSSGKDHDPYWPQYRLKNNQRDDIREEVYRTYFSDGSFRMESYEVWKNRRVGDSLSVKKSLAGIQMGGAQEGKR